MPDAVLTTNVLAGGVASRYPAGNYFPTTSAWEAEFVDYAGGDYRLSATSVYRQGGTDGADLGANIAMVRAHGARALEGDVTDSPSDGPPGEPAPPPLEITTNSLADGSVNLAYDAILAATGGTGDKRWSLGSGELPGGLTLDERGRIDGVPTSAGTFTFGVQVVDSAVPPATASRSLLLTIGPAAVAITTLALPAAVVGAAYQATLDAAGGSGGYTWSVAGGALPAGLDLSNGGTIAGTPTTPGTFPVTVQAADTLSPQNRAMRSFSIDVAAPAFAVSIPPPPPAVVGQPFQVAAAASGQIGVVTWSIASGGLPPGVTLNASTGMMSGTPAAAGAFSAVVRGQDTGAITRSDDAPVTIVVSGGIAVVTSALPAGNVGSPYTATLEAAGSTGPVAWSLVGGSLPSGISLDSSGGISGSPTGVGTSTFTVRAVDSSISANAADRSFTLAVGAREIVLDTSAATIVGSAWSRVADTTAAAGTRVWNRDRGRRVRNAVASPASYVEITFVAEAGVPYHLWLRSSAERNSTSNDSVYVQFSDSVDANGAPILRIGTRQSAVVELEDQSNAGVHGWGWQDNGGSGVLGQPVYFAATGVHTVRLQVREDGISVDQIVLSAGKYASVAPGVLKDDAVIVPR
jgi:hypothetical protein